MEAEDRALPAGRFASTRWSRVLASAGSGIEARGALAWLCERYWEPLRAHARRRGLGDADADDLTQDFFCTILAGGVVERADPARGRFRTFLLACLEHHLSHHRERDRTLKRGGGQRVQGLMEDVPVAMGDPGHAFDRDWADTLLQRVRDRLAAEAAEDGGRNDQLMPFLTVNGDAASYADIGGRLGVSEGAVKVAVHRLRVRFRELLREEVAETLAEPTPAAVDAELRDLLATLRERP